MLQTEAQSGVDASQMSLQMLCVIAAEKVRTSKSFHSPQKPASLRGSDRLLACT